MPLNSGALSRRDPHEWIGSSATWSRPLVVELVGLAGAGKTAVLRALRGSNRGIRAGLGIDRLRFAPVLAGHAIGLLPTTAELLWRRSPSPWLAAQHLLRLRTLPSVLARESASTHRAIVLDEGPVFSLSRLCVFQDASRAGGRLTTEWRAALKRSMALLDGIVWLDAAEPVLLHRIRERHKAPVIKGGTEEQVAQLLKRYRTVYQQVVNEIRLAGRATIIEVDTATHSADQVAALVLAALPLPHSTSPADRPR